VRADEGYEMSNGAYRGYGGFGGMGGLGGYGDESMESLDDDGSTGSPLMVLRDTKVEAPAQAVPTSSTTTAAAGTVPEATQPTQGKHTPAETSDQSGTSSIQAATKVLVDGSVSASPTAAAK
jgi:hypothetical protein